MQAMSLGVSVGLQSLSLKLEIRRMLVERV